MFIVLEYASFMLSISSYFSKTSCMNHSNQMVIDVTLFNQKINSMSRIKSSLYSLEMPVSQ